ncbi:MAG TPA: S8 family serine peptidase [Solirubrobacteraceae bacterium]|nr:S8 family serine peptidase [Solirubrobacteraceae bacterium]
MGRKWGAGRQAPHLSWQALRLVLLGLSLLTAALAFGAARARAAAYVPREVIVGYRPGAVETPALSRFGVRSSSPAPAPGSRVLHLRPGESVSAAIARLRRQSGVAYAVPNYIAHVAGGSSRGASTEAAQAQLAGEFYPNDGGHVDRARGWELLQWNMLAGAGVNAPEAWANLLGDRRGGGKGVVVAVLDTGVAYRNWKQFHRSPDFGRTHFVSPFDFVSNNKYPLDRNGHGTFVAGIIAESTNNGVGLTGLAYGASIMPIRVLDSSGEGDEATIARGIRYAVDHGAQIINLSLEFLPSQVNSGSEIPQIVSAIGYAHRHGVTVVGAAGNDETDQIAYPARAPGVISVGATTKDRCLADYSNGGSGLDIVAPGGGNDAIMPGEPDCHPERSLPSIYQLTLTSPPHWNQFGYPSYYIGTSMSSPEVAATAALLIASRVIGSHPTPDQILARLEETATTLPIGGTKPNSDYGYGLLNAGAATTPGPPAPPTTTPPPTTTTPTTPTSATPGG